MGFLSSRFPDRISQGAIGGPTFNTEIAFLPNGKEGRNGTMARARHSYDVGHGIKSEADHGVADEFFRKARGRLHAFRFKDWADYRLSTAQSRLVQITSTTFRISKVYGADEPTFEEVRPLTRPVPGTVAVYKDAILVAQGPGSGECTVNTDTGVVTFGTAPGGATLSASCQFDVPCRFDFDEKRTEIVSRRPDGNLLLRWDSIRVLEDMAG